MTRSYWFALQATRDFFKADWNALWTDLHRGFSFIWDLFRLRLGRTSALLFRFRLRHCRILVADPDSLLHRLGRELFLAFLLFHIRVEISEKVIPTWLDRGLQWLCFGPGLFKNILRTFSLFVFLTMPHEMRYFLAYSLILFMFKITIIISLEKLNQCYNCFQCSRNSSISEIKWKILSKKVVVFLPFRQID